jgi:hypothetical protein
VAAVAPQGRASVTLIANGRNWVSTATGSTDAWFDTGNWKLSAGRRFDADELSAGAAVCLLGETVRRELFGGAAGRDRLGEQVRVKQFSCEVIGILAAKGQGGMGDQDDVVLVPLHTLQRLGYRWAQGEHAGGVDGRWQRQHAPEGRPAPVAARAAPAGRWHLAYGTDRDGGTTRLLSGFLKCTNKYV